MGCRPHDNIQRRVVGQDMHGTRKQHTVCWLYSIDSESPLPGWQRREFPGLKSHSVNLICAKGDCLDIELQRVSVIVCFLLLDKHHSLKQTVKKGAYFILHLTVPHKGKAGQKLNLLLRTEARTEAEAMVARYLLTCSP